MRFFARQGENVCLNVCWEDIYTRITSFVDKGNEMEFCNEQPGQMKRRREGGTRCHPCRSTFFVDGSLEYNYLVMESAAATTAAAEEQHLEARNVLKMNSHHQNKKKKRRKHRPTLPRTFPRHSRAPVFLSYYFHVNFSSQTLRKVEPRECREEKSDCLFLSSSPLL